MINIFISRPTWIAEEFREGLTSFLSFLGTHDLKPRTIGSTDYPTESDNISGALMKWKASIIQRQKEKTGASSTISTLPSIPPTPTSGRFDESVESVLLYLFQTSNSSHRTIASICHNLYCVKQAARYCIDKLLAEKMITKRMLSDSFEVTYTITPKGRSYVMNNKLITI